MPPRTRSSKRSRTPRWSSPASRHAGGQTDSVSFVDPSFARAHPSFSFTGGRDRAASPLGTPARDSAGRWQRDVAGLGLVLVSRAGEPRRGGNPPLLGVRAGLCPEGCAELVRDDGLAQEAVHEVVVRASPRE